MSGKNPSTPVKVPKDAANYTPAMQDHELRSTVNAILLSDGYAQRLQEQLLHLLHANKANWPTAIQSHALSLLRSGEVTTFPALMKRVLADVRQDTALAGPSSTSSPSPGQSPDADSKSNPTNGAVAPASSHSGESANGNIKKGTSAPSNGTSDTMTNDKNDNKNDSKNDGKNSSNNSNNNSNNSNNNSNNSNNNSNNSNNNSNNSNSNSNSGTDSSKDKDGASAGAGAAADTPTLAVPQSVVDEMVRLTRDCLKEIVDFRPEEQAEA